MSGHSKWANIQHRKKAQDAKRGKLFSRLIREITIAARMGGSDPNANPRLRLAAEKAVAANMGKDSIERAIKRGAGDLDGQNFDSVRYEGFAPAGVAVIVDCMTDNRNRTVAEVRFVFNKYGGNLGESGSVAYLFKQSGVLTLSDADEDAVFETALEAGADDVIADDDGVLVLTAPDELLKVKDALAAAGCSVAEFGVEMRAENAVDLDAADSEKVLSMLDALEELDDVQDVYCNANFIH